MSVSSLAEILPDASPESINKHAEAVARVSKIYEELVEVHDVNDQLRADLHREQDRVDLLIADRDRWRVEALTFRSKLIELSTLMSQIGLLTRPAEDVLLTIGELTHASSEAIDKLAKAFNQGNEGEGGGTRENQKIAAAG